ncbi:MAG: lipoyl(octanoyl) transferase LipB [Bdellovibrionales bacterium]|nr:lipoyl(octanoyl) transferase LipB [Bdellovibrionales bacterium]
MMSFFFSKINLSEFQLDQTNIQELNERTLVVRKWNWEYGMAHKFQRKCLELLEDAPHTRIIICCSHPRIFTNGRGLQKPKKGETLNLVEFDKSQANSLPYPFYQIERGGGLTFHHPGQMIIYPIVRLNPKNLSLSTMINDLFDLTIASLKDWGLEGLNHENKLLGLWYGDKKLASMGIAIEKLTTFHGMALNFFKDDEMKQALNAVNPCGLNAETYTSVEELINLKNRTLDNFADLFLRRLSHAWK